MGYDMTMVETTKDLEAFQAAEREFYAAVKERDELERGTPEAKAAQARVSAAYEEMSKLDTDYFRLNIWGMSKMRDLMGELGMLSFVEQELEWPDTYDEDAYERVKSHVPEGGTGIVYYKLCSNDGWHVTPEEISQALTQYRAANQYIIDQLDDDWRELFEEWVAYLERAEKHGGFRVW